MFHLRFHADYLCVAIWHSLLWTVFPPRHCDRSGGEGPLLAPIITLWRNRARHSCTPLLGRVSGNMLLGTLCFPLIFSLGTHINARNPHISQDYLTAYTKFCTPSSLGDRHHNYHPDDPNCHGLAELCTVCHLHTLPPKHGGLPCSFWEEMPLTVLGGLAGWGG